MSDYKQESIRRRDVRAGIGLDKERSATGSASSRQKGTREWVIVYFTSKVDRYGIDELTGIRHAEYGPMQIGVWGEYRSEDEARTTLERAQRNHGGYFRQYYCHIDVYTRVKKALKQ